VVDALSEVASRDAEQQGKRNDNQAGEHADQQGDAYALEGAVDHVAAQDVGAEQMRARMAQRLAAVERDPRERRRVAGLLEGIRLEDAVDDASRLVRRDALAPAADPGDRIEQRDEEEDGDHDDGGAPPPPQPDGALPPVP